MDLELLESWKSQYYDNFDWEKAPLISVHYAIVANVIYLILVALLFPSKKNQENKKKKEPTLMTHVVAFHNLILSFWSLVMFVGALYEGYRRTAGEGDGLWWIVCERKGTRPTGPFYFWVWLYYISKYYELLDTVFSFLKGSIPPSWILNVYHHVAAVFMAWSWGTYSMSVAVYGVGFNTFVHIVMYYYYFIRSYGYRPWWKNHITKLQLTQFFIGLPLMLFSLLYSQGILFDNTSRHPEGCSGAVALACTLTFVLTLIIAFLGVLQRNTSNSRQKKKEA